MIIGRLLFIFLTVVALTAHAKPSRVIHLEGSPYEMGFQHGQLLKEEIDLNLAAFIDLKHVRFPDRRTSFKDQVPKMMQYIPSAYLEEMQGVADGSKTSFEEILMLNLFPEMFHCTGLTVKGDMTTDGSLYHVRVLDYSVGKNLQQTAVLIIAKPDNNIPFINVSYAGFIGSVTGMNAKKIAIGEIGGGGYGEWDGMPMTFLMRQILEQASNLEEVKEILEREPRTCEYYYVISDGNNDESIGVYATSTYIQFIKPGSSYEIIRQDKPHEFNQPNDTVAIVGHSHLKRYMHLIDRLEQYPHQLDVLSLQEVIKQPVSMPSNLHNVIFLPSRLQLWVAHAGEHGELACDEPYEFYDFTQLLLERTLDNH